MTVTNNKNIAEKAHKDSKETTRRKAIKTILGSVGALTAFHVLPTDWSRPLVEQIFLPAHAGTSSTSLTDPCRIDILGAGDTSSANITIRISGFVVPPTGGLATLILATPTGGGSSGVPVSTSIVTAGDGTFTADITLTSGPSITSITVTTTVTGASGSATCTITVPATGSTS